MPPLVHTLSPSAPMPEPYAHAHVVVGRYAVELRAAIVDGGAALALQSLWSPQPHALSKTDVRDFLAARDAALPALMAQLLP